MDARRITDALTADHARLESLLRRATREALDDAAKDTVPLDMAAYAAFREGLLRHIAIEEKILFPAVKHAPGHPLEATHALRVDHAAIGALLVPTPDLALCRELHRLLADHDAREEGPAGVYAACEHALGESASIALAEKAAAYPRVPTARFFDGHGTHRTVQGALALARRARG
jgi:hypothetical protein